MADDVRYTMSDLAKLWHCAPSTAGRRIRRLGIAISGDPLDARRHFVRQSDLLRKGVLPKALRAGERTQVGSRPSGPGVHRAEGIRIPSVPAGESTTAEAQAPSVVVTVGGGARDWLQYAGGPASREARRELAMYRSPVLTGEADPSSSTDPDEPAFNIWGYDGDVDKGEVRDEQRD